MLRGRGYERLYTHQRQAYDAVGEGRDTVVVTPTASGKTLCYNLPVLDRILKDPDARALYLFPTKALAQDQLAELYAMIEALGADIGTFTYDGDTPQDARKAIRARAHIVVTNPDMLHKGILPHHTKWVKLFENLQYVIVDELHTHRGVYGSHVANLFRRLHRLCRFYGSDPQFLCSSATIGNPKELAEALTGREMTLIDESGAPRGEKYFAIYNPPVVNRQLGIRQSALGLRPGHRPLVPDEGPPDHRLRSLAPRHRDPGDVPEGGARDAAGLRGRHPRLPRRLPSPEAAGDRARACARARSSASSPRTPWSWGSTSAASTPPSSWAIRGAWPRPGSRRDARGAGREPRWRCSSPTRRPSTSSSRGIPTTSSARRWSRDASTPTTSRSS